MDIKESKFIDVMDVMKKNIIKYILTSLIFAFVFYLLSCFVLKPKYESKASLIINNKQSQQHDNSEVSLNDIQANQKLVNTYTEIIKTRGIADKVIQNLDLDMDYEEFKDMVSISTKQNTEVFEIKVVDNIPERAADIVNETSNVFKESIVNIMKIDNVKILDKGIVENKPIFPRIFLNTIIGFILGFIFSVLVSLFKELSDTTFKTTDDISEAFDIPVLGMVPDKSKGE